MFVHPPPQAGGSARLGQEGCGAHLPPYRDWLAFILGHFRSDTGSFLVSWYLRIHVKRFRSFVQCSDSKLHSIEKYILSVDIQSEKCLYEKRKKVHKHLVISSLPGYFIWPTVKWRKYKNLIILIIITISYKTIFKTKCESLIILCWLIVCVCWSIISVYWTIRG